MIIRLKKFSKENDDTTTSSSDKLKLAGVGGLLMGSNKLHKKVLNHEVDQLNKYAKIVGDSPLLAKEDSELFKKLKKIAKKRKTYVSEGADGDYFNKEWTLGNRNVAKQKLKERKDTYKGVIKMLKDDPGLNNSTNEEYVKHLRDQINDAKKFYKSKDFIGISPTEKLKAGSLAHELGHSMNYRKNEGSFIGRLSHKIADKQQKLKINLSNFTGTKNPRITEGIGAIAGFASGINAEKKKAEGKKEGVLSKTAFLTTPLAYRSPELISEFEATRQGHKLLKRAGASKKYLSNTNKHLGHCLGTYASSLIAPVLVGYGSRQIGNNVGRHLNKKKDKNYSDNSDEKDNIKLLAGGGLLAGGSRSIGKKLSNLAEGKFNYAWNNKYGYNNVPENIIQDLKNVGKKQGTAIINGDSLKIKSNNPVDFFTPGPKTRNTLKEGLEKYKAGFSKEQLKDFKKVLNSKDFIAINKNSDEQNSLKIANLLAEGRYVNGRTNGTNKIGRLVGKLNRKQSNLENKILKGINKKKEILSEQGLSNGLGIVSGLASGIRSGRKKAKGEKESILSKASFAAPSIATSIVPLIHRHNVNRQTVKVLKEAGANNKFFLDSAKKLGKSEFMKNVAGRVVVPVALGYGARQIGKVIGKHLVNKKKDNDTKKN